MESRTAITHVAPWLALIALAIPFGGVQPAAAQHQHDGGAHELQLDHGQKWSTDAPLRRGMVGVRDAIAAQHAAIHADRATAAQYQALAGKIDGQIADIVQNCKLPPEADAQLHVILTDIIGGSDLMKGADEAKRRQGAVMVVEALGNYPQYFDHPGWRPLE
jgi:hypothetical protein